MASASPRCHDTMGLIFCFGRRCLASVRRHDMMGFIFVLGVAVWHRFGDAWKSCLAGVCLSTLAVASASVTGVPPTKKAGILDLGQYFLTFNR